MTEAELVAALKSGEDAAYERAVRENAPRLLAVARRMLDNEADAADAVQEGFLSAWKSIARFDGGAKFSTWLHRIVVNASLMKLRTRRRKPERSIEDFLPDYLQDGHHRDRPQPWREPASAFAERQELKGLVHECIRMLPDDYRTVLLLRDIEELDTEETATMLEISTGAVKTRLHRARQALRTCLDPHFREGAA